MSHVTDTASVDSEVQEVSASITSVKHFLNSDGNCCLLVSTYVVCERLSVMHEPAGVVEILVQILQNTRSILKYSFRIPPPPPKGN